MHCAECKTTNAEGNSFCGRCGAELGHTLDETVRKVSNFKLVKRQYGKRRRGIEFPNSLWLAADRLGDKRHGSNWRCLLLGATSSVVKEVPCSP
jgi:hypothetical protein